MMGKMLRLLDQAVCKATDGTALLGGWLYLLTALIVTYEIVVRGLFDAPTEWTLEISVYFVLISGFLGLAATYADDKHIRVDVLTERLSARWQKGLAILTGVAGLAFAIVFFTESLQMTLTSFELESKSTSTLRVPLFIPQLALPLGGLLLMLQFVRRIIMDWTDFRKLMRRQEEQR